MFSGFCHSGKKERRGLRIFGRVLGGIAVAIAFALVFGVFVQMLWNWLMPDLFKLGTITYGQAFGLMLLARMIFGGMGRHHREHHRFAMGKHGFHGLAWRGCGCSHEDEANHDIDDWQHYDAWWDAEGREAYKKYAGTRGSEKKSVS